MDPVDNTLPNEEAEDISSIEEGTAAAETLKPGGGSGASESKAKMLDTFVSLMSQLGKEDLSKFMNDALAQIGKEADKVPDGAAASNKNSISAKASAAKAVKEDLDEFLGEEEDFTEDFKEKASTLFEAAVNTRINLETVRLEEEFADKEIELREQLEADLQENANTIFEQLTEKLDQYLNYNVETYMEENTVELESQLRNEIAENFIYGLQNLFAESFIKVPEDKIDILGEMKAEIADLKEKLNETINTKIELERVVEDNNKKNIVDAISADLVDTQREKMASLAEGLEYADSDGFKKKLEIIKESYFGKKATSAKTGMITEEIDGEVGSTEEEVNTTPEMQRYLAQASKGAK